MYNITRRQLYTLLIVGVIMVLVFIFGPVNVYEDYKILGGFYISIVLAFTAVYILFLKNLKNK